MLAIELVYVPILTNPSLREDWVKIGKSLRPDDIRSEELTEDLWRNRTIDWQKKESARAGMRSKVKRLLKKYKYPPEEEQSALETVIHQCEQWADADVSNYESYE